MTSIIIYSHGFGVKKDGRGLFTDIASSLPNMQHIMFDYNEVDEASNTLIACPLDKQAEKLNAMIAKIHGEYPDATMDIIAHSQGCIATAIAAPTDVRSIIFLAPPAQFLGMEKSEIYAIRPDTINDADGTLHVPRRDGSMTIIKNDYWLSREGIKPIELYNRLANRAKLTIITATKDEVLTDANFTGLSSNIALIEQLADHNFTGEKSREIMMKTISRLVNI